MTEIRGYNDQCFFCQISRQNLPIIFLFTFCQLTHHYGYYLDVFLEYMLYKWHLHFYAVFLFFGLQRHQFHPSLLHDLLIQFFINLQITERCLTRSTSSQCTSSKTGPMGRSQNYNSIIILRVQLRISISSDLTTIVQSCMGNYYTTNLSQ